MCYKINCQCETVKLLECPSKDKSNALRRYNILDFFIQKVVSDNALAIYMSHESFIVTHRLVEILFVEVIMT